MATSIELDKKRKDLYELNTKAWNGEHTFKTVSKLDSSLKKNTAFIKKIKIVNADQCKSILKDIETLSIERYLSEVIVSLTEALCKVSKNDDILAAMDIVSALHQRFTSEFSPYLMVHILTCMANPMRQTGNDIDEKEENSRVIRQRNSLRLVMEFYLIGIFRNLRDCNKDMVPDEILMKFGKSASEPIIIVVIKDLLNFELKSGNSLSIVQPFLKRFYEAIYKENDLLTFEVRNVLQQIFNIYSNATIENASTLKKRVQRVTSQNKKAAIRTGRILEEIQSELDALTSLFEKFKAASEFLADILEIPLPNLNLEDEEKLESDSVVEVVKAKSLNEDDFQGVWEDIKEKNFYTIVPSLGELIGSQQVIDRPDYTSKDGEKIQDFLNRLEDVGSNDMEQLVVEFNNLNLNNKATKNRLMKFFIETSNVNNLKYYTRFLKINEINLTELITELITYLDKGFRHQLYQNKLNFKNILFFVEMIKFKMIPIHMIFHKIRTLTMNITLTNNIDILAVFYEHVGRFLLHEPEYKDLMQEMINLLREKSKQSNLTINQKLAINNLLLIVNPPATKVQVLREREKLSPKQQFIQRLIRVELDSTSLPVVLNLLGEIPLKFDEECCDTILDCFANPELLNYDNIPALAKVLSMYSDKYKRIVVFTVDTIIEKIVRGLELNDYRMNRARMSHVKFIAELYNAKVINFKLINDLLYKLLCYGHPNNQPLPNNWEVEIDLPDNYFRIQLCCLLLTSLTSIFVDTDLPSRRKAPTRAVDLKKRNDINKELLGVFTTFLQYYLFCKEKPLPIDIQFKLDDLFTKYKSIPTVKRYDTIREVIQKLQESIQTKQEIEKQLLDDDDDENFVPEDEADGETFAIADEDEEDDDADEDEEESDVDADEDEDEDTDGESEIPEAERIRLDTEKKFNDDLEKELQKIMIDSYNSSSNERAKPSRSKFNMPLPQQVAKTLPLEPPRSTASKVSFGLLTRSGKNTDVRQLNLPSTNKFAESVLKEKRDQIRDRENIMRLVSRMED
ncbi:NMD2 [[Candida] subhashii]|uniref:NMD2 n=1 Tax=[Candida] subhashii TaxID=561895 RepID=A0A8J5Q7Z2_9ASCO|nr:NMD2 [[Candida] subhashii]KAG7662699.1 NMD2 [[Candida] subhashii]